LQEQRDDRQRELKIQERIGTFTIVLAVVAALQVIVTILGYVWVKKAADAARDNADAASDNAKAAEISRRRVERVRTRPNARTSALNIGTSPNPERTTPDSMSGHGRNPLQKTPLDTSWNWESTTAAQMPAQIKGGLIHFLPD
jgi:hypothetical protein